MAQRTRGAASHSIVERLTSVSTRDASVHKASQSACADKAGCYRHSDTRTVPPRMDPVTCPVYLSHIFFQP